MLIALTFVPFGFGANVTERLTTLFVYVILAVMWNALAGYAGLVSVGQQMFFGLGAYATIRLSYEGMNVYAAMLVGSLLAGLASLPLSSFMLRLRGGEFAIATWVVATIAHLLVNFDPLIEGETGKSLIALNAYEPSLRQGINYWATLGVMVLFLGRHVCFDAQPVWRRHSGDPRRRKCRGFARRPCHGGKAPDLRDHGVWLCRRRRALAGDSSYISTAHLF